MFQSWRPQLFFLLKIFCKCINLRDNTINCEIPSTEGKKKQQQNPAPIWTYKCTKWQPYHLSLSGATISVAGRRLFSEEWDRPGFSVAHRSNCICTLHFSNSLIHPHSARGDECVKGLRGVQKERKIISCSRSMKKLVVKSMVWLWAAEDHVCLQFIRHRRHWNVNFGNC